MLKTIATSLKIDVTDADRLPLRNSTFTNQQSEMSSDEAEAFIFKLGTQGQTCFQNKETTLNNISKLIKWL